MHVDRAEQRKKRDASTKKLSSTGRKPVKRQTDLKSSNWYQSSAMSLAIPLDRREQR